MNAIDDSAYSRLRYKRKDASAFGRGYTASVSNILSKRQRTAYFDNIYFHFMIIGIFINLFYDCHLSRL